MDRALFEVSKLVLRQDAGAEAQPDAPIECKGQNEYDGRIGVRISAIFVILIGSLFGTLTAFSSTSIAY